ncbi:MAG: hypothetical protein M0R17_01015 [Candidatus Omnitrophica bacterium]|jgi:hypothetical protein|nr:hypothetical protein [Candidatus Omnitrophota bacterium]
MNKLIMLLFAILIGCDSEHYPKKLDSIDPMKVSKGVASRFIADNSTIHNIDSSLKLGYSKIKIKFKNEVIVLNDYNKDTININWNSKMGDIKAISIEVDSSNEFIEIPLTKSSNNNGFVVITPDSSLLPGIFNVLIRGKDSLGNYTAAISKCVVINSGKIDFNNLKGLWNFKKFTTLGSNMKFNRFHYIEFENSHSYEWFEADSIIKHNRNINILGLILSGVALSKKQAIMEDFTYITNNDHIRFMQRNKKQAGYKVLTLINDRMIVKENANEEGNRFAIMMKINSSFINNRDIK